MAGNPHPAALVYPSGSNIAKADIIADDRLKARRVATAQTIRDGDWSGQYGPLYVAALDAFFEIDTADTTTADDGTTCIVDANGVRFKSKNVTLTDPAEGASIGSGNIVKVTKADGATHVYRSLADFSWGDIVAHEYGASPTILALHKNRMNYGACVQPTDFSTPPFAVYYTDGRIQSALDTDQAFRDVYLALIVAAGNVFYVDQDAGSNSNDGRSWARAKAGISGSGGARDALVATSSPGIIYVKGISGGGCYDRNNGISHTSLVTVDYALIGVPAADGSPVYMGNVYASSEVSFAPESATPGSDVAITGITQANPGVVSAAAHGRSNGDRVLIYGVAGMTQVNGNIYTVANKTADTFELSAVDSTGFGAYTSGGKLTVNIVYQTSTVTMTQPGRACDLNVLRPIIDESGREHLVPTEYVAATSLVTLFARPGSYWFDSANTKYYVNMIGGGAPAMNVDLVVPRSTIESYANSPAKIVYAESIRVVGGYAANGMKGRAYFNRVISLYSSSNGFSFDSQVDCGTKDCITIDSSMDGINYHNAGTNISAITNANPAILTVSATDGLTTGDSMQIGVVTYGGSIGMNEIAGQNYVITVIDPTHVSIPVDSSGYGTYTASSAKLRPPSSKWFELNPTVLCPGAAAGANQASTSHENCEGIVVNGLYAEPWRDHVTDIGTSKRWMIRTRLEGTKITATSGSHPKRFVLATDAALVALDGVQWGGFTETAQPMFEGNTTNKIRLLNTDCPKSPNYTNVTASW